MLADFCLRLALGMTACLLLLSPARAARHDAGKALARPAFFRTHLLVVLGLACGALLFAPAGAGWPLTAAAGTAAACAFLGSAAWMLERSPGAVGLTGLTGLALLAAVVLRQAAAGEGWPGLLGALSAAALLGAATSAMLMGHSYLTAPALSLAPLYRLLAVLAAALAVRAALDGAALGWWASGHRLAGLAGDALVWLPVRWGVGLAAPLVLCWMAWQAARIRSTQSATGILYVVVVFCFLGELTAQLLQGSGLTL
jgi:hypothetical protein